MPERRHLGEQARGNGLGAGQTLDEGRTLGVDEGLHRLVPRVEPRLDEILALADEEPEPLALPPRLQPPEQLESSVRG
jgi:hypothetical protein